MKLLISALLLLPTFAFAQAQRSTTQIDIKPWWPVYCEKHNYPFVDQVSEVEKLDENENTVTFGLKTTVGSCEQNVFVAKSITSDAVTIVERSKLVLFQKITPVIVQTVQISPETAAVKMTFDKKNVFKKKNQVAFDLAYYPNGRHAPIIRTDSWGRTYIYEFPDIRFFWNVQLTKIDAKTSTLKVRFR